MGKSYSVHIGLLFFSVLLVARVLVNYSYYSDSNTTPTTPNHHSDLAIPVATIGEPVCRAYVSKSSSTKTRSKQGRREKWQSMMSCPASSLDSPASVNRDNSVLHLPSASILDRLADTPLVRDDYLKLFNLLETGGVAADIDTKPRRKYPTQWFHVSIQTNDCSLLLGLDDDDGGSGGSGDSVRLRSAVSSAALASAFPHSLFLARALSLLDDRVKQAPSNVVIPRNFVSSVLGEVLEASIRDQYARVGSVNISISDVPGVYGGKSIRQDRNELVKVDWRVAGRGVGMQVQGDAYADRANVGKFGKGARGERVCVMGKLLFRQFVKVD